MLEMSERPFELTTGMIQMLRHGQISRKYDMTLPVLTLLLSLEADEAEVVHPHQRAQECV